MKALKELAYAIIGIGLGGGVLYLLVTLGVLK